MNLGQALLGLLVFPGLLYALPAAWMMLWVERKICARMQNRIGPPFFQPFFDFIKLLSKQLVPRDRFDALLMTGLPILAAGALLVSLALLPVFAHSSGFAGDLVLLVALLEVAPLCAVLAGYASRSVFGQVGAAREAVFSITYNVPFLAAIVALAVSAQSIQLADIVRLPAVFVRVPALLALCMCLPAKLRLNPFSLVNAEQEIYEGPMTEYAGPRLALWELAHGLEWVALAGVVSCFAIPGRTGIWFLDMILFMGLSLILVLVLTAVAAGTARLTIKFANRFYLRWGLGLSLLSLILGILSTRN